jgi:hypothetical protein
MVNSTVFSQLGPWHDAVGRHILPPATLDDSSGLSVRIISRLRASPLALLPLPFLFIAVFVVFFIVFSLSSLQRI